VIRADVSARIREIRIIQAALLRSAEEALFAAESVSGAGIPIVVAVTVPGALDVIQYLALHSPGVMVDAGTVLDLGWARRCLDAGARFLTSPGFDRKIVEFAVHESVVVFPGALTPTDVMECAKPGAEFIKIFPCAQLGGPSYIRALKSPFPDVPLIAGRCQPAHCRRFHSRRCVSAWRRQRPDSRRRDPTPRCAVDSGTVATLSESGPSGEKSTEPALMNCFVSKECNLCPPIRCRSSSH
jgi:2-dehydro-3-deoxyphosphogluconate aldolase/(4S)-4-hydroxy-2-oxoglutarate aldolase